MGTRRFFYTGQESAGEARFLTGSVLVLLLLLISSLLHLAIDDYRHYSSFDAVFEAGHSSGAPVTGTRFIPSDNAPSVMDGFKEFILAQDRAGSPPAKVSVNVDNAPATAALQAVADETLVLRGTVVPGFALFEDKASMRQEIFHEGEKVFERGTLVSVQEQSARVELDGKVFTYRMGLSETRAYTPDKITGEGLDALKRNKKNAPGARSGNEYANLARRTGVNNWEIDSAQVDKITGDISSVISHARITIYKEAGVAKGYRISKIKPTGVLSKVGLKNGDLLLSINGYEITSTTDLMKLIALLKLKGKMDLTVDLIRAGEEKTLNYRMI